MAERGDSCDQNIGFKAIQLFKDQTLGIGGYGAVCKAKCDDLLCAAKILHPTLFDPIAHQQIARRREHRLPIKRFEQECEFMSAIRHPNIVQYLCTYQDPDTGLPVLLMELMDDSLTHFLESSTQPIPYHIQVNICHDIALALSFLHSNNIIHRDLSGNNVLLIGNIRAKVTDFGMARLGDLNPQATRLTFTMCPGTDVYMPPEAVRAQPVYSEKVDCFSFGVIIVQILSRQFPKPGDRLKTVHTNDPQFPRGIIEVRVSEVERRHNHISQIDSTQPLMLIANDCLKDDDAERPSAQQLLERVVVLKESPEYIESARPIQEILNEKDTQIQEAQEQIQTLTSDIETKDQIIGERNQNIEAMTMTIATLEGEKLALQSEVQSQQQQHEQIIQQKDQLIAAKELAISEKEKAVEIIQIEKSQLEARLDSQQLIHSEEISKRDHIISGKEETITNKEKEIRELKRAIKSKEEQMHQKLTQQQQAHMKDISKKNEFISAKDVIIAEKSMQIEELEQRIKVEEEEQNRKLLDQQQQHLQEITQKNKSIMSMEESITEKDKQIRELQTFSSFSGRKTSKVCTFGTLLELLRPCSHKWYELGFYLGLKLEDLNLMLNLKYASEQLLCETLKLKLKSGEELTWGEVVIALFKVGEAETAQEVARQDTGPSTVVTVDYKTQRVKIHATLQQRFKQGDIWYVVDVKWVKQWKKYVGYDQWDQSHAGEEAANPGPIDNSSLFRDEKGRQVRDHLMEELDYFLLPESAWNMLVSWYGLTHNSKAIARKVVEHGMYMKQMKVEVYLLEFKLAIHPNMNNAKLHSFSRGDTVGELEALLRKEFEVERDAECRVWHRFMSHTYELLSNPSQTVLDAGLYNGQTIVLEKRNEDGSWPRQTETTKHTSEKGQAHTRSTDTFK